MEVTKSHLRTMLRRVSYGLPLTVDEQRWLIEQVTGVKIVAFKRCPACNANGFAINPHNSAEKITCEVCGGNGYQQPEIGHSIVKRR